MVFRMKRLELLGEYAQNVSPPPYPRLLPRNSWRDSATRDHVRESCVSRVPGHVTFDWFHVGFSNFWKKSWSIAKAGTIHCRISMRFPSHQFFNPRNGFIFIVLQIFLITHWSPLILIYLMTRNKKLLMDYIYDRDNRNKMFHSCINSFSWQLIKNHCWYNNKKYSTMKYIYISHFEYLE